MELELAAVIKLLLETAAEVATVYGFLYALPNSIEQMRLTNISGNAAKALEQVFDVRKAAQDLFEKRKKSSEAISSASRVCDAFQRLIDCLEVILIDDSMQKNYEWAKRMMKILKNNSHDQYSNEPMITFFREEMGEDWRNESEYKSQELDSLREKLKQMHSHGNRIPHFFEDNRYFFGACILYFLCYYVSSFI